MPGASLADARASLKTLSVVNVLPRLSPGKIKNRLATLARVFTVSRISAGLAAATKADHSFIIASSTPSAPLVAFEPIVPMAGSSFTMYSDESIFL